MLWWLLAACSGDGDEPADTTSPRASAHTGTAAGATGDTAPAESPPACPTFGEPEVVGMVDDAELTELSGITRAGSLLWTHNDSGGRAMVYGLSDTGAVMQRVAVDGAVIADWEDITVRGEHLWVGDIGDNFAIRDTLQLYELPIPTEGDDAVTARRVRVRWPDGPMDSEALFADPVTHELLLMSKVYDGFVTVGRVPDPDGDPGDEVVPLEAVATVQFGNEGIGSTTLVTGADMSPDGRFVVVRTYTAAWAFPRIPGEDWADTFGREPCEVPAASEGQAEAITWDAAGVWTVSEGQPVPLHRVTVEADPDAAR